LRAVSLSVWFNRSNMESILLKSNVPGLYFYWLDFCSWSECWPEKAGFDILVISISGFGVSLTIIISD
jgi:hypothetical protein